MSINDLKKYVPRTRSTASFYASFLFSIILFIRFASVDPAELSAFGYFFTFALIYLIFLSLLLGFRFKARRGLVKSRKKDLLKLVSSMVIAFAPVAVLALGSLGQLGVADVVLIVFVQSLLHFYIRYQFS